MCTRWRAFARNKACAVFPRNAAQLFVSLDSFIVGTHSRFNSRSVSPSTRQLSRYIQLISVTDTVGNVAASVENYIISSSIVIICLNSLGCPRCGYR